MTIRLFADLLLVLTTLASALCVARGFLTSSPDLHLRAALLALLGGLIWFAMSRQAQAREKEADDPMY